MLDNRLRACAAYVSGKGILADIGTDHGYLPCFLVAEGVCEKAIAADINEGPLGNAREHIRQLGLDERVQTVLSDGLDSVPCGGVTDVVIAGMGGELIMQILQRASGFYGADFILQPMTKIEYLRRSLWDSGFDILSETACKDGFYYTVMHARYTGITKSYTELQTYIGMMKADTDDEKGFLLRQAQMLEKKGSGLLQSSERKEEAERYLLLAEEIRAYINDAAKEEKE